MDILSDLLAILPNELVQVRNVTIGVHWTLVCSRGCGLGSTLVNYGPHGHTKMRGVGNRRDKGAQELDAWIKSDNLLEASVGIAAINSLIPHEKPRLKEVNASEVIEKEARGRNLVVVGHFPFASRMKDLTKNTWIIEKKPFGDDFPEEAAGKYIPQADVVAITGTAFINHTIENLLSLCRPDATVMVLGPSTPMVSMLFDHGIRFLSGSLVTDEEAARLTIQQGASFPQVKGVRVVTMEKNA